jgi:hypothetical protein
LHRPAAQKRIGPNAGCLGGFLDVPLGEQRREAPGGKFGRKKEEAIRAWHQGKRL